MKDSKELALQIADFLYSKKGENIQVLDVSHLTSIAEYFVICSARNTTQCRTMAVCHDLQIVEELPAEEHDIRPDAIVSEERILL